VSIDALEKSAYGAAPQELYLFTRYTDAWRFTDWDQDVQIGQELYLATVPHTRNEPEFSEEVRHAQLKIKTTPDHPVVDMLVKGAPNDPVWVTVYRMMLGDSERLMRWQGKVISASIDENSFEAELLCEPVEKVYGKSSFRHTYGPMCRHRLYGTACGAVEANFSKNITITGISDDKLTLVSADFAGKPVNWWRYGSIWISEVRRYAQVVSSTGSTVVIRVPIPGLAISHTGKVTPGCDHVYKKVSGVFGDCKEKFDNTINFGGFPFTPTKNPYVVGLEG